MMLAALFITLAFFIMFVSMLIIVIGAGTCLTRGDHDDDEDEDDNDNAVAKALQEKQICNLQ